MRNQLSRWVLTVALAVSAPMLATTACLAKTKHQAKLSMDQAREIALAKVPGKIKTEEMEKEKGIWIYSFEIRPDGETKKIVKEVNVDADTGKIVDIGTERD